ncbi:hypothetical protein SFC66_17010 [Terribacillus saccharophilus]|uniref:hypothetical protein n=1 Tax=Terribacillus saccharophilus TaxID=361277 RepID=UPI003982CB0C
MRQYDSAEMEELQEETSTIVNNGVPIIVKKIPGEVQSGGLDPRELSLMADHWAGPSDEKVPAELPPLEEFIPNLRESMGFPNYNLNTVEIHTKYEEITESGNTVGLWRYYPRKSEKDQRRPALVFIHGGG